MKLTIDSSVATEADQRLTQHHAIINIRFPKNQQKAYQVKIVLLNQFNRKNKQVEEFSFT